MNGWEKLRGYRGSIRFKPHILWRIISDITQKIVYFLPKNAFQLFAVKNVDENYYLQY